MFEQKKGLKIARGGVRGDIKPGREDGGTQGGEHVHPQGKGLRKWLIRFFTSLPAA